MILAIRFTVAAGEKIYVRVSSDTAYTGMEVGLRNAYFAVAIALYLNFHICLTFMLSDKLIL